MRPRRFNHPDVGGGIEPKNRRRATGSQKAQGVKSAWGLIQSPTPEVKGIEHEIIP